MIKIIQGDLLQAKEDIIGHQVNCQGKMGSGVALQIKKKFPSAYEKYMEVVDEFVKEGRRKDLLGIVQMVEVAEDGGQLIANIFGQYTYGYDGKVYTNTNELFNGLIILRRYAEKRNLSVALPYRIGSYRGGAKWEEVEELIERAFNGYEVTLYKLQ